MSLRNLKGNIALIGFMGSGKSAVGRRLAQKLQMEFIETDNLIEKKAGETISSIFKEDGEQVFRTMESSIVKQVSGLKNSVISCGGGVVLNPVNISELKKNSLIVYLFAAPSVILKRVDEPTRSRPLLNVADPASAIDKLFKERKELYEKSADLKIDTSQLSIEEVVDHIIAGLK